MNPTELTTRSAWIMSAFGLEVNYYHSGTLCWYSQRQLPLLLCGIRRNASGTSGCRFSVKKEMVHPVRFPSWWFISHNFLWGSVRGLLRSCLHQWVRYLPLSWKIFVHLHDRRVKMEATFCFETLLVIYQSTRRYISTGGPFHYHYRVNLLSHVFLHYFVVTVLFRII